MPIEATFQLTLSEEGTFSNVIQAGDLRAIFQRSKETVEVACKALELVYSGGECVVICPNADLSGIGVKIAFYLQSFLNATLVMFCPADGASGAWASTVLTGALIIPATIQLFQNDLTLYHANLVLLFATLSTVTSLAVAPIIPIWREGASGDEGEIQARAWREEEPETAPLTEKAYDERTGRVVLAVALLCQMSLQWTWCLLLWCLPHNFAGACSGETRFFWFTEAKHTNHLAWTSWLIFCLGLTLGWAVIMVFSCHSEVHDLPLLISYSDLDRSGEFPRHHGDSSDGTSPSLNERTMTELAYHTFKKRARILLKRLFPRDAHFKTRIYIRISQLAGCLCFIGFVIISELQTEFNRPLTYDIENVMRGFSQFAALLLAMSPAWPLGVEFMKRRHKRVSRDGRPTTTSPRVPQQQQSPPTAPYPTQMSPVALRAFPSPELYRPFQSDYFGYSQSRTQVRHRVTGQHGDHTGEYAIGTSPFPAQSETSIGIVQVGDYEPQFPSHVGPSSSFVGINGDVAQMPLASHDGLLARSRTTTPLPAALPSPARSQEPSLSTT